MPDRDHIVQLIESADTAEGGSLADRLAGGCWPGGGDRHDRIASEWLRRWRPARAHAAVAGCACGSGPCGICN